MASSNLGSIETQRLEAPHPRPLPGEARGEGGRRIAFASAHRYPDPHLADAVAQRPRARRPVTFEPPSPW